MSYFQQSVTPVHKKRWHNAVLMLGQRRRRWLNIKTALCVIIFSCRVGSHQDMFIVVICSWSNQLETHNTVQHATYHENDRRHTMFTLLLINALICIEWLGCAKQCMCGSYTGPRLIRKAQLFTSISDTLLISQTRQFMCHSHRCAGFNADRGNNVAPHVGSISNHRQIRWASFDRHRR